MQVLHLKIKKLIYSALIRFLHFLTHKLTLLIVLLLFLQSKQSDETFIGKYQNRNK